MSYSFLADLVLILHFAVVIFVVGGLLAIPIGNHLAWHWVNGWPFRLLHSAAIAVIVVQAWLGQHCPLTVLEVWLRTQAGEQLRYEVSFVQYWIHRVMYFDAPLSMFAILYTAFATLVALAWLRYPPRSQTSGA